MAVQITVEGQTPKYLTAPTYTLGRAVECDVRLPENDRMVSRQHARIERMERDEGDEGETWWLVDLSTNGTFVNGERMSGRRALQDGDQIGIGRSQISFAGSVDSAPLPQAPAHNAETFFVNASELQAKVKEATSRLPAASAPASRPVWSKASLKSTEPPASTSSPSTPSTSLDPVSVPFVIGVPKEEAHKESSNGSPAWDSAPTAVTTEETPVLKSSRDTEQMKQCSRCRHRYALEEKQCPSCRYSDFSIKGAAPATVMVTDSAVAPLPSPIPAPSPVAAPSSVTDATPFDRLAEPKEATSQPLKEVLKEPAPATRVTSKVTSNGVASTVVSEVVPTAASDVPVPFTPRVAQVSLSEIPTGITFGPLTEPSPKTGLGLVGLACGLAMLLSLVLPWVQVTALFETKGLSYVEIYRAALQGGSGGSEATRGGSGLLRLLVPAVAALISLGASIWFLGARRKGRGSSLALACGGALGLLGAALLLKHLGIGSGRGSVGSLEMGFWLFALSSLGALVVGLSRLSARR